MDTFVSITLQDGTLQKNVSTRRKWLGIFSNTSSYMAVPIRATLLSALVLVPYIALVPIASMVFSNSIHTTSLILIVLVQILGAFRFPVTLLATFVELTTIEKRAHLKTRAERQKSEREVAWKTQKEQKRNKMTDSDGISVWKEDFNPLTRQRLLWTSWSFWSNHL